MNEQRITVITGASSGIGLAACRLFTEKGDKVYGISRRPCPLKEVRSVCADITDEDAVTEAFAQIAAEAGKIDVLISNAGFGISGAVEFTRISEAKRQFDVNVFGTMNCVKAVLPYMRKAKKGHIIVTSSVAGLISIPFQAYYSASKAALLSLVLATANEVRPYGIKIAAVMPGDIKTNFTAERTKIEEGSEDYKTLKKSVATMEKDEIHGMQPIAAAKRMYKLSVKKSPKPLSSVGFQYRFFCTLDKFLPVRFSNWVVFKLYADK